MLSATLSARGDLVTFSFSGTAGTVIGTPFGTNVTFGTPVSGLFTYDTDTGDVNPAPGRGDYPHTNNGGFTASFSGLTISGSSTPFVQVEDLNPDTFRFIDGPRLIGNQGGVMSVNG
ncbi:MAG: hypothetical protein AAF492_15135, partial [Verrucomicrobiota bacterium]